ncbi:hypothetical protein POTOM_026346 [Populus tomentosa]|uniref:Uncharacterized protein n=1 Tax=Populus tomentosa TaxID=118781 RepID=A0A8X7ZMR0_POPTO|nr:hypothetical protein POTOM_026346 [Populus tomentosa]
MLVYRSFETLQELYYAFLSMACMFLLAFSFVEGWRYLRRDPWLGCFSWHFRLLRGAAAEASIASSAETSSKVESSLAKPSRSTSGTEQNLKPRRWISSSVTPNQITSAIAASEKSHLRCSVVVALLAVLSHLGFPLLGSNLISSIINFRPLYLVLLNNVTLVLFNNQRAFKGDVEAENKIPSTGGTDWTEQASEALKVAW